MHEGIGLRAEGAPVLPCSEDALGAKDAVVGERRVGDGRLDAAGEVLRGFDEH